MQIEGAADAAAAGADLRLRRLVVCFELEPVDIELLLVALMPDLDARFERLYGYLHDDVSRRRASIGLALELAGDARPCGCAPPARSTAAPLVDSGLVVVEDPERPFLTRSFRVPDRVAMHLLGDDHADPTLAPFLARRPSVPGGDPTALARAITAGATLCSSASAAVVLVARSQARRFAAGQNFCPRLDLRALSRDDVAALTLALREARLRAPVSSPGLSSGWPRRSARSATLPRQAGRRPHRGERRGIRAAPTVPLLVDLDAPSA